MDFYKALIKKHFSVEKDDDVAAFFYKDLEHRYQYVNENLLTVMRYYLGDTLSADDILEKKDLDIYPDSTSQFFKDFDKEVIHSEKMCTKFQIFELGNNQVIHAIATKIPIFDDNHQIIGILGKTRYLNFFRINGRPVIISQRELDILAHVVFGLPMKKIASNLGISVGSVASYLNRLKLRIHCYSQSDIIKLIRKHALSSYVLEYLCRLEEEREKKN
jgi:DNA-binding CsgD family transcriptional regulator